jgi:hypothetical protein
VTNTAHQLLSKDSRAVVTVRPRRIWELLDFSEAAYGDSWDERTLRLVYLKEILDRIELPPFDEIPGDEDVASGDIEHWTIPATRITIAGIGEDGREDSPWADRKVTVHRGEEPLALEDEAERESDEAPRRDRPLPGPRE